MFNQFSRLHSRSEVISRPSSVPSVWGIYAWFFKNVPGITPTDGCECRDGKILLYIGIAPDAANKPMSKQSLRNRLRTHYSGNAEGSTLRRTIGILISMQTGFPLRRVGSGKRMTFTHLGEQVLDRWMEENAFVCWLKHPSPWEAEEELLKHYSCPLNIKDNSHHPFSSTLHRLRTEAIWVARELPIADERSQHRSTVTLING